MAPWNFKLHGRSFVIRILFQRLSYKVGLAVSLIVVQNGSDDIEVPDSNLY